MTPTCSLVFEIPELAGLITSLLSPRSISNLMQTSRRMHATMEPWFYHNLTTVHVTQRVGLWRSPDGLTALARNFRHTKSWKTDLYYFVHFFHATAPALAPATTTKPALEELDQEQKPLPLQGKEQEGNGPSPFSIHPSHPLSSILKPTLTTIVNTMAQLYTSLTDTNAHIPVCVPPMTLITRLDVCLESKVESMRASWEFDGWSQYSTVEYLCATLARLPHLRELTLRQLFIQDTKSARAIVLALRKMMNLIHFRVILLDSKMSHHVADLLLFGCPPSIRSLDISKDERAVYQRLYTGEPQWTDAIMKEIVIIKGKVQARGVTTPLTQLRDLHVWNVLEASSKSHEDLYAVFGRCPNVENLRLSWMYSTDTLDGARIARMCPKIRNITYGNRSPHFQEWPYKLSLALPEHQLEMFRHGQNKTSFDGDLISGALMRHSRSLRDIQIRNRIPSKTVAMILKYGEALEVLDVRDSTMDLEDAIGCPWACSRLRELHLDIDTKIPRQPSYLRPPPSRRFPKEKQFFGRLEILYRQIGKLMNLRYLHLSDLNRESKNRWTKKYIQPFPGLLRLSDKEKGIVPGYLELLSGLTRLKEIRGSVAPETPDHKLAADAAEVDWILEHWPELALSDFFPASRMR
ncbi:MAG: hypothetical protein JOS17DRAFT_732378 [Linnemannia elongata]|nr:MAG: hypothetical protein JOS17DRAFT_732378 [Linnemannia elongata]